MSRENTSIQRENRRPLRNGRGWGLTLLPLAAVATIAWRLKRLRRGNLLSPNPWMPLVTAVDRKIGWHRLPWPLGLPLVFALMGQLRRENLADPSTLTPSLPRPAPTPPVNYRTARTADGSFNDLSDPEMGSAGTRFGRNVRLARTFQEPDAALLSPNPRTVSRELMTRHEFQPAATLNVLTAAWI